MTKWTSEQLSAIEKDGTNIIVSAGAGSGKTAVLSERVVSKLKKGIHIDELLILTFTRAAAEEMKDRIRRKIESISELRSECERIDSAYITTFDSYALSIVKRYSYLLNISKDINITDESIVSLAKSKVLDELFLELYAKKDNKFLEFIDKYTIKNDKEIKNEILDIINKIDGYLDRDGFIDYIKSDYLSDETIDKFIHKYISLVDEKKHIIEKNMEVMRLYFDSDYITKIEEMVLPLLSYSIDELSTISLGSLPRVPNGTSEDAKNAKSELKDVIDDLFNIVEYGSISEVKDNIKSTFDSVHEIADIASKFFMIFDKYKKDNNIYTFQDIAKLAIKVFDTYPSAKDEIKYSLKEIMIDEYQDTNDIQEAFISYIENNNVYMVGDIKQSIYKFRGSNPNIFKDKYDKYSLNDGGVKIDLLKNFRSRSEVLDNTNSLFGLIMDNDLGGAEYLQSHAMEFGNTAYLEEKDDIDYNFEVIEYNNETDDFSNSEVEIFAIARDIQKKINDGVKVFDKATSKLRTISYSDFVIILDRSSHFEDFRKVFEYLGIPLTILKDGELNASVDLELIKNIIDLIIKINDKVFDTTFKFDFMSVGRSFLYEYSDQYLFDVIANNDYGNTTLYKDLSSINNLNAITSSELLNKILSVTKFYDNLNKVGDYENTNVRMEAISNIAKNISSLGFTIHEFKDYLDDIITNKKTIKYEEWKTSSDSVKILTIHKSKGLEYSVCYFADLAHDFNLSDIKSKIICDKEYGIIVPNNGKDSILKLLFKVDYKKEEISERIRLFYVALTRAREKIIIVLPSKEASKYPKSDNGAIDIMYRLKSSSLADFVYLTKGYLSKYFKELDISSLGLSKKYLYKKDIKNIDNTSTTEFIVDEINIENEEIDNEKYSKETSEIIDSTTYDKMKFGTKVHEVLEYIDFNNFDEYSIDDENIRNYIKDFISKINIDNAKVYKEYEFYYNDDNKTHHGVIDLMLEYNDHIDIIDYKLSNIEDDNYLKQLSGYKKYISSITDKEINCYLYSILNKEFMKI